jgi:hypothetical protein
LLLAKDFYALHSLEEEKRMTTRPERCRNAMVPTFMSMGPRTASPYCGGRSRRVPKKSNHTDTFYGASSVSVGDPFGHVWVLLSWKEDLDPAEMERRGKEFLGQ